MQFVARNVAKVELNSTSATVTRNVARKVESCVPALLPSTNDFTIHLNKNK